MLNSLQGTGRRVLLLAAVVGILPAVAAAQQSYLGVSVQEVDATIAQEAKLAEVRGVAIRDVVADSAAAKAGIEEGDVELEYNGQRVVGVEQFRRLVRETPAGREVTLRVSREGQTSDVTVEMGSSTGSAGEILGRLAVPRSESFTETIEELRSSLRLPDTPRVFTTWRSSALGIEAESLNEQLAEYFGVEEGVLVRSVAEGTAAEKAGFRAGDVILQVGGDNVTTPREVTNALRDQDPGEVAVSIMRERQQQELTVTIEAPSRSESFRTVTPSPMFAPFGLPGSTISY